MNTPTGIRACDGGTTIQSGSTKIIGPADTTGQYQAWLAKPLAQRTKFTAHPRTAASRGRPPRSRASRQRELLPLLHQRRAVQRRARDLPLLQLPVVPPGRQLPVGRAPHRDPHGDGPAQGRGAPAQRRRGRRRGADQQDPRGQRQAPAADRRRGSAEQQLRPAQRGRRLRQPDGRAACTRRGSRARASTRTCAGSTTAGGALLKGTPLHFPVPGRELAAVRSPCTPPAAATRAAPRGRPRRVDVRAGAPRIVRGAPALLSGSRQALTRLA